MPQVVQQGSINTTALVVPDLYVQITPPQNLNINGVPTNIVGVVGTATWGPVGTPVIVGTLTGYNNAFGAVQNRKYDAGTAVAIATQQGASNFRVVRVSDGTDERATVVVPTSAGSFSALWTGSYGNGITVTLSKGSAANTWRVVVGVAGRTPELFDNISGTGNTFWLNVANAVNNGTSIQRGPSQLVTFTASSGTNAPTAESFTLTGGTDGVATITAATLVGSSASPYTGMYALQGQGCSVGVLADADDSTQWTTQAAFGLANGLYMICVSPAGSAIANGTTGTVDLKATAGLDSYAVKLMHGDWLYWNDQTNNILRLVSPQGFAAGLLGNLSPDQSSLNKQLYGVVGSQKSGLGGGMANTYAAADLQALFQNGVDVICNPQPGGTYWGVRGGRNSSSNSSINGDNYARMTNYIAFSIAAGMGIYVGKTISSNTLNNITATLNNFFYNMLQQGILSNLYGKPYSVVCDTTNNPQSRTSLGYVQADMQVTYKGIIWFLIGNLEGGQTVTVSQSTAPQSSAPATPAF